MKVEPCVLEGTLVRLEPLVPAHLPALCEHGLDPDLWRWTMKRIPDEAAMEAWMETALQELREGRALPFAVRLRASGELIGSSRFSNIDPVNRKVEIGWSWIGKPWHGTGVNAEMKLLMFRHAFEHWGCARVEFKANAVNERSRKALLKIGAKEEGVFRKWRLDADGKPSDVAWFSITDEDWPACRSKMEAALERLRRPEPGS